MNGNAMWRSLASTVVMVAALLMLASPAAAHLSLERTTPADGDTLTTPVTEVRLQFSVPGTPAGSGIELLGESGTKVAGQVTASDGGRTWILTPAEQLGDGVYGVRWQVAAPDSHPRTGSFRFAVSVGAMASDNAPHAAPSSGLQAAFPNLDDALATPDTTAAQWVRWAGSAAAITGAVLGIGGLAFLWLVMAGRRSEIATLVKLIRWSAVVLIVGSLVQVVASSAIRRDGDWVTGLSPQALSDLLSSSALGGAVALRLLGGLLVLLGVHAAESAAPRAALATTHHEPGNPIVRATLQRSRVALLGASLCLISFLLDGHTETAQPRPVVWVSDIIHVLAVATWVGGIAMLATVLWRRRRSGHALDAAYLAVKFSVVAAAALVLAGISGSALTLAILDEPEQLWMSAWGRVLILKVILVAIVAAIGAYNHFRLIPLLERAVDLRTNHPHLPEESGPTGPMSSGPTGNNAGSAVTVATRTHDEAAAARVSRKLYVTAYVEGIVLLGVIGLTGWLVHASTVL